MKNIAWRLFLFGLGIGLISVALGGTVLNDDSRTYIAIAENVARGVGFLYQGAPTMVREPGYPLFLAAIFRVFGENLIVVRLIQAVLMGWIAAGLYLYAKRRLPERTAVLAAAAAVILPQMAVYAHLILLELLLASLLLAFLLAMDAAERKPSLLAYLGCGALLGIMVLTRSTAFPFVLIAAALVFWKTKKHRPWLHAAVFVVGALLLVLPWAIRNEKTFGTFSIASRAGQVLYVRAHRAALPAHDRHLIMAQALLGTRLTAKIWPDVLGKRSYLDGADAMGARYDALIAQGVRDDVIDAQFKREAVALLLQHPFAYATDTIQEFFLLNMIAVPVVDMRELFAHTHPAVPGILLDAAVILLRFVNFAAIGIVLYGLWSARKNAAWLWPAALVIYWNLIYMAIDAIPRYAVPILPIYALFAAVGLSNFRNSTK